MSAETIEMTLLLLSIMFSLLNLRVGDHSIAFPFLLAGSVGTWSAGFTLLLQRTML